MTLVIHVPDYNDSFSRVVLAKKAYLLRFTYHLRGDYWTFGIYNQNREPYVQGVKIVPNYPLNFFYNTRDLPDGTFAALTKKERIGRNDFREKQAEFVFIPHEDLRKEE